MQDNSRRRLHGLLVSFYNGKLEEDFLEEAPYRKLYRKLYFELFRNLGFLHRVTGQYIKGETQPQAMAAVVLGAAQLLLMRDVPDYAAVNESVALVHPKQKGFVNAILRRVLAGRDEHLQTLLLEENFPEWYVQRWRKRLGARELIPFLESLNATPPLTALSVADGDIVTLEGVEELSGTELHPMDRASIMIAGLVPGIRPKRILDACSAPGGKTLTLSALYPDAEIVAVEKSRPRAEHMAKMLAKYGKGNISIIAEDLLKCSFTEPFDLVLLDAPCSCLGTMRRHPEVRWLRSEADLRKSGSSQRMLLSAASQMVASGGHIIYSVCTMEEEETTAVVRPFLKEQPEFSLVKPACDDSFRDGDFFLSLPHRTGADGFFAACLKKQ